MNKESKILSIMTGYFGSDIKRINHALKVYGFAKAIAEGENLTDESLTALIYASILHDIGIIESERKYNSSAGKYQEIEGPPIAKSILEDLKINEILIDRICYLIGHHHTYGEIQGLDFQILVEADFLVNIFEDEMKSEQIKSIGEKYFKTESGKAIFNSLYKQ